MSGTGAVIYSLSGAGKMGMRTCSHLKGKTKARKASMAYPNTVLDCETKIIFFSSSTASKTLMMHCRGRNLNTQ
jgi:hypothetical protein